jgi:tRNA-dihydrouridine synthase A
MMGLWNGTPGARRWRQVWSDHHLKELPPRAVAARATAARLQASAVALAA